VRAAFALALALAGGPAFAQGADAVQALRAAFQGVGCVMNRNNQDQVLDASGLTADAATDAVGALIASGELLAEGETLRLVSGDCAGVGGAVPDAAAMAERRARVAAALAARGCRVNERDSTGFAADLGLPSSEVVATLLELVGRGEARLDRSGDTETIILTVAPCDGGAPAAPVPRK
jgi:hypothetical protein